MAKHSLDKRLKQIESSFTDERSIRFFIKNGDQFECMQTRRKSDNINDLITGREKKNIIFEIVNPREND